MIRRLHLLNHTLIDESLEDFNETEHILERQQGVLTCFDHFNQPERIKECDTSLVRPVSVVTLVDKTSPVALNLLLTYPSPTFFDEAWVTDITYLPTRESGLYLAAEMDL